MRLRSYVALATAFLSTSYALENDIPSPTQVSTGSRLDDLIPSTTPFPHLEIRQNLGQDLPGAVAATPGQVPPVTVYSILSQAGDIAKPMIYTYTQVFEKVLDQFPLAKPGQIGMGGHRKREEKREAAPVANTEFADERLNFLLETIQQPLVLQMETVMITQEVQQVTETVVVETWAVTEREQPLTTSETATSQTATVSHGAIPVSITTTVYGTYTAAAAT